MPAIIYGAGSVHKGKRYKCTVTGTWKVPSQVPETGGTGMGWFAQADNRNYHSGIANVNYYPVLVEAWDSKNTSSGNSATCNFVTETDCNKFKNCIYETDTEAREQLDATCADSVSCASLQCTRPTTNSSKCEAKTYCRDKTPEEMKKNVAKTTNNDDDDESVADDGSGGVVSGGDFDSYDFNLPTPYSTTMIEFIGSASPGSQLSSSPSVDDSFECYVFNHKCAHMWFLSSSYADWYTCPPIKLGGTWTWDNVIYEDGYSVYSQLQTLPDYRYSAISWSTCLCSLIIFSIPLSCCAVIMQQGDGGQEAAGGLGFFLEIALICLAIYVGMPVFRSLLTPSLAIELNGLYW